ncbi:MAG: transcriptional regulator NrdR [bacterium]
MKCPTCQQGETKVIDSRAINNFSIRRRRECLDCGARFSTVEDIEILNLAVVKRNGDREPYLRQKLEIGIRRACEKRPFSEDEVQNLINTIEHDIQNEDSNEIKSKRIGEIVMNRLREKDQVAYIRFASVYKDFKDVESFEKEIKVLSKD